MMLEEHADSSFKIYTKSVAGKRSEHSHSKSSAGEV